MNSITNKSNTMYSIESPKSLEIDILPSLEVLNNINILVVNTTSIAVLQVSSDTLVLEMEQLK